MMLLPLISLTCAIAAFSSASFASDSQKPPVNPFLADSHYQMLHANAANTDSSYLDGPVDQTRALSDNEIHWRALGPGEGWEFMYSGPYPDGSRVIWAGGSRKLVKMDARSLDTISTYVLRSGPVYSESQSERFMVELDDLLTASRKDANHIPAMARRFTSVMVPIIRGTGAFYRLISSDNEQYQMTNNAETGTSVLEVYGDATPGDPRSAIELKRSWTLPQQAGGFSAGIALNMTYDGWVVIATADGWVYAVSRDLKTHHQVNIAGGKVANSQTWMAGYVRNGIAIDEEGGIYVVTRDNMHRVQWTGNDLSVDPGDGAWAVPYPSGARGSGVTPTLMGWGDGNDKLVSIADGVTETSLRLYWRGDIPDDWQGIPGEPRRLAGAARLDFGAELPDSFPVPSEASMSSMGYGIFTYNDYPMNQPTQLGDADSNIFANILLNGMDDYRLRGGVKYEWVTETNELRLAWNTSESIGPGICNPATNGILYCMGRAEGQWAMKTFDWKTGESGFRYLLGNSVRMNPGASVLRFSHYGDIDCPCGVGWGILRLSPDSKTKLPAHVQPIPDQLQWDVQLNPN